MKQKKHAKVLKFKVAMNEQSVRPGMIATIVRSLLKIGFVALIVFVLFATARAEEEPTQPLQDWQYQAVLGALNDPVRAVHKEAILWLAENAATNLSRDTRLSVS